VVVPEDSTTSARALAMTELIGDALQSTHSTSDPTGTTGGSSSSGCRRRCVLLRESIRSSTRISPGCSTRSSLPRPAETVITVSTRWRRQTCLRACPERASGGPFGHVAFGHLGNAARAA
jgi:hypothetical protein